MELYILRDAEAKNYLQAKIKSIGLIALSGMKIVVRKVL